MANEYLDQLQTQAGEIREPVNPYLETLKQAEQGATTALRGNLSRSVGVNPEQFAAKKRVAEYLGYPTATVEAQPQLEARAKVQQIDQDTQGAPALRAKFTDADFAKLAHDDVGNLSAMERALKSAFRPVRSLAAGASFDLSAGAYGVLETGVKAIAPILDPLSGGSVTLDIPGLQTFRQGRAVLEGDKEAFRSADSQLTFQPRILPENPLRRAAAGLEDWRKNQQAAADRVAGDQSGAGFVEQSINSGFRSTGQMLPGLTASVLTGNPYYMAGSAGAMSGSNAATKALDAGKTPMQAIGYGAADATAELVTEMIPVGRLLKDLKAGAPFIKVLGRQIATEVPTELAATAWQGFNEWAALHSDEPISTYFDKLPEEEAQTIIATITQSVLTAGMGSAVRRVAARSERNKENAEAADTNALVFGDLDQLAAASKVRGRDAQSFQQFVEQAAQDGPVQDIYIDAKALAQSGVIEQLAEVSPAVAAQFEEALATGGDVRIPVGEFAASIAGTDLSQSLLDHLKTDPNGMSRAEAQEFMQSHSDNLQAEIEQALGEKEGADTFRQSAEVVKANVQDQLNAVARFTAPVNDAYSTLVSNFYAVTAAKMGTTPEELFTRYPLRIAAERTTGESLDQGAAQDPDRRFTLADLPRDMREELFNEHAMNLNPDATEKGFYRKNVPSGLLRLEGVQVDAMKPDEWSYLEGAKLKDVPPVVIADGRLIDGQHRINWARANGYTSLRYIDVTGLIDTDAGGFISELPKSDVFNQAPSITVTAVNGPVTQLWGTIAQRDDAFQTPTSNETDIGAVLADVVPELNATVQMAELDGVKGEANAPGYVISVEAPDGSTVTAAKIFDAESERPFIEIGHEQLSLGSGTGKLYQAIAGWALNNGKTLRPDPRGLSEINELRRTEQMIASMLKYGESRMWEPDTTQFVGLLDDNSYAAWRESGKESSSLVAKLEALKLKYWGVVQPATTAYSVTQARINNMSIASMALAARRAEGDFKNAIVDSEGNVRVRDDAGSVQVLDKKTGQDAAGASGSAYMGVGYSTRQRALLTAQAVGWNPSKGMGELRRLSSESLQSFNAQGSPDRHARAGVEYPGLARLAGSDALSRLLYQSGDQTQTAAFRKWSGDAPVIEADGFDTYEGGPAVFRIFHGTASDFDTFAKERANPESDLGAGFYFTNTPEDVSANYAGEGPDLTQRIQMLAERIASETDRDYSDPEVVAEAKEQLAVQHQGAVVPAFVKVQNPVLIGGDNETRLAYEQPYDEDIDEYGEETGTLVDFIVALRNIADSYHDGSVESGIDAVLQEAMDRGEISASELIQALKNSEEFGYFTDDNGTLASTEIIRQAFEAAGFDGFVDYTVNEKFGSARASGRSMQGMDEGTVHVIAFEPTQIKSSIGNRGTFDPNDPNILNQNKDGNRGAFNPATNTITLLKNADLSTFLHESGHFFLETTFDIAARPEAPAEMRQDADVLLKWFGVQSLEEWHALDFEEMRGHHEKFARGFEAYLFEGKSPNTELQGLFQRFRAWLVNVYKEIKSLNVELTDEVRGVMDRMLATADEIKFAEQSRSMMPLFASPETSGMTPEEFAEYHKLGVDATNDAVQDLQAKGLRDMQWLHNARGREIKKLQKQSSELRKQARMDVSREVMSEPIYQAWQFLTSKGEEGAPAGKIAISDVVGDDATWQRLRKLKMISPDGLPADTVAEMFGFTSGNELVRTLADAPLPKDEIEARTDVRMLEEHGELSSDEAIEREADRAIHNDARARFIATETNALAKAVGKPKILADAAREFAKQTIARLKLRDIRPSQYANAETRAAKNAEKALKNGDLETAAVEKRNQLVNNYATRAAYDAREEVEKSVAYLKKFESAGVRKGLDAEYTDQIDTLLERFDLREQSNVAAERTVSLRTWVQSRLNAGEIPQIAESLLSTRERAVYLTEVQTRDEDGELVYAEDEDQIKLLAEAIDRSARRPYRDMTVEEFRGLVDTVKQIEHLGRLKHKILTARDQENYEAVRDTIAAGIAGEAKGSGKNTRTANDWLGKRLQSIKQFGAAHIKVATWARIMDGGKDNGPVWRYLVQPANERATRETTMRAEATATLDVIMRPVLSKVAISDKMGKGKFFPSIGDSLNWQERFTIALNVGNESNMQRLLGGKGWTVQQIKPVLDTLTAEEWQAAQAVWDHFESYRPQIAEKELRVSGKEPEWIAARQITVNTADGQNLTLRGGYYPVVFDPRVNLKASQHSAAEEAKNLLKASYSAATTRRSFTKERVDEVNGRPLLLNLQGLYSGVNDVIHDLAWHEWVIDANKLLRSKTIDAAMREHYGPEVKREFEKWRDDIVTGTRRLDHAVERAAGWARQSVSASALTFNVMTAALQPLGLANSMSRIGTTWVAKGLARYVASPIEATREAQAKSAWLANRTRTRFRELNELRNQVQGQTAAKELMGRYGYWMMMRAQLMVDVPTWWGAYEKAIADGHDEQTAVNIADQSVKDAQGGGEEVDQSGVERGGPLVKLFTAFYGFMGTTLNTTYLSAKTEASKAKIAANMALTLMVPAVIGSLLKDALTPGGDEDEEGLVKKLIAEQLSFLLGLVAFGREFSQMGKTLMGEAKGQSYSGPSGLRLVPDTYKLAQQSVQGEFDDSFRKAFINVLGDLTGIPSVQINKTITGGQALADGETSNPAALVFGYRKQ